MHATGNFVTVDFLQQHLILYLLEKDITEEAVETTVFTIDKYVHTLCRTRRDL